MKKNVDLIKSEIFASKADPANLDVADHCQFFAQLSPAQKKRQDVVALQMLRSKLLVQLFLLIR